MPHGKCSRAQGAQGALESSFATFVVSQFTGRRDGRHFTVMRRVTATESTRAAGP